jgi:hypothetical protein
LRVFFFNLANTIPTCTPNPCLNQGRCRISARQIFCDCAQGFMGSLCQVKSNDVQETVNNYLDLIKTMNQDQSTLVSSDFMIIKDMNTLISQDPGLVTSNLMETVLSLASKIF